VPPPLGVFPGIRIERPLERQSERLAAMIILGLILLVAGFLLKVSILWTIGIILLIVGAVLAVMGSAGRAVGGRRHYF
jgi:hypothetical protein